ncbi:MAG: CsgG/HfaB family protein [Bryobacteraceae bacterium]
MKTRSQKPAALFGVLACAITLGLLAAPPAASQATKSKGRAAAAAPSMVDTVIELVKGGMSEDLILGMIAQEGKKTKLGPADMLKLNKAGVSDSVIKAMMGVAPAAAPAAAAPKAAAAPAAGAVAVSGKATDFPADLPNKPTGPRKRRVAVDAFDYSAVRQWVTYWFQNDVNIGEGIRSMLVARMHQSKNVVLLERKKIDNIMKEQDFGATNRVNQGTRAKIGKITGADAILMGDIVIFGRDDNKKNGGIGGIIGGKFGAIAGSKKEEKAVVGINLRIVDAETGEVLETAEARGESKRTSRDWSGVAAAFGRGTAGQANAGMNSSNFEATIIGEATSDAVNNILTLLDERIPKLSGQARSIEGRVANIQGSTMYLTIGANDGVQLGDRFEIHRIDNEVIDPETKEVLDKVTVKVGEFVVHNVREKISTGQYGGQPVSMSYQKGYAARLVVAEPAATQ